MRKLLMPLAAAAVGLSTLTGCASKKFVTTNVDELNDKVEANGRALERTQVRQRNNERRIDDVDRNVQSVGQTARNAHANALDAASATKTAAGRLDAIDRASRRLVYDLVVSDQENGFRFGQADLPADTKASIDRLMAKVVQLSQNIFVEIEGHTDGTGASDVNRRVGLARAESVRRYLHDQHHIPLHKMNVISFGGERPVAPNSTPDGRAQNRRVVIRILG